MAEKVRAIKLHRAKSKLRGYLGMLSLGRELKKKTTPARNPKKKITMGTLQKQGTLTFLQDDFSQSSNKKESTLAQPKTSRPCKPCKPSFNLPHLREEEDLGEEDFPRERESHPSTYLSLFEDDLQMETLEADPLLQGLINSLGKLELVATSGQMFGENALIGNSSSTHSAVTLELCHLMVFSKESFEHVKTTYTLEFMERKNILRKIFPSFFTKATEEKINRFSQLFRPKTVFMVDIDKKEPESHPRE